MERGTLVGRSKEDLEKLSKLMSSHPISVKCIEILKYDGDAFKFVNWWKAFEQYVHQNDDLPAKIKLEYLKSLLSGPAASCICDTAKDKEVYDKAVCAIRTKFGRSNAAKAAYLRTFLDLKPMETGSLREIAEIYDEVVTNMKALRNIDVSSESYHTLLYVKLLDILTPVLRLEYLAETTVESLDSLLVFLAAKLEDLDAGEPETKSIVSVDISEYKRMADSIQQIHKPYCAFCQNYGHWGEGCSIEMPLSDRREILSKQKRCFRCFRRGHRTYECNFKKATCEKCKGPHFLIMCPINTLAGNSSTADDAKAPENTPIGVLMQTVTTEVRAADGQYYPFRFIMARQYSRSYIRQETSLRLNLPVVGYEYPIIPHTIYGPVACPVLRRVRATLRARCCRGKYTEISLELLEVSDVYHKIVPWVTPEIVKQFENQKLMLADHPPENPTNGRPLDALIGADYYFCLIPTTTTGNIPKCRDGMFALQTIFGWTVASS